MGETKAYESVLLLIPEPFVDAWSSLIGLCQGVSLSESRLVSCTHWPVLGLTIRGAHTTLSVATLAAMRQWPEACILGRTLFETEILVKWLLESDTDQRVAEYLAEVEDEKARLQRKMEAGRSISAQVMRELFPTGTFNSPPTARKKKASKHATVRSKAQSVNLDRSYDLPYWMMSIFAHSHAVSLSKWDPAQIQAASPLVKMFDFEEDGLPAWMVLTALPMSALDLFQLTNHHLNLGLSERITATRQAFWDATSRATAGLIRTGTNVERGELRVKFHNGTVKSYKPTRSGRDPVDDLP